MTPRLALLAFVILGVLGLAGCSSATQSSAVATVTVTDAWVRVTGGPAEPAAGYLTIVNHGPTDDALVSASSPRATTVTCSSSNWPKRDDGLSYSKMEPTVSSS